MQLRRRGIILAVLLSICSWALSFPVSFAQIPEKIIYEGRLLNTNGTPVTTPREFRFSLWKSEDFFQSDLEIDGSIAAVAPNYSNWQEEQTVQPNASGTFSLQLGKYTPLPMMNFATHRFLQVEVKAPDASDREYQLLDPTGDQGVDGTDRNVLGAIPFAFQAEEAAQTSGETFFIDADNSVEVAGTGVIALEFGKTLDKYLAYDLDNGYFVFNDDVHIEGDLTVTGLINGVNITSLPGGHVQNTDTGTDADTFELNTDGAGLLFESGGLSADRTISFDDADTIVVGTENVQTLTNKTIDASQNTLTNIAPDALQDRNKSLVLSPEYNALTLHEDGTANIASFYQGYDAETDRPYYKLTSQEPTLQDIDLQIVVKIPEDFVAWQAVPLQIFLKTSTTDNAENQIDVTLIDTTGTPVSLNGGADLTGSLDGVWTERSITFSGTPVFTPGETIILRLKLQAHSNYETLIGTLLLNYIGK